MGANYEGQEKGIEDLRGISNEAREFLCHHLRNAMNVVIGNLVLVRSDIMVQHQTDKTDVPGRLIRAQEAAEHLLRDLKKIGC